MWIAARERGRSVGRLQDIGIDAEGWRIVSLVLDSRVWLPGRRRVIVPGEVRTIDWTARAIELG